MKTKRNDYKIKNWTLKGVAFSSQAIIAVIIAILFPFVFSIVISFTNMKFHMSDINFVWFSNYAWVFNPASGFFKSVLVSLTFSFVSTILQTILGFLLSVLLYFLSGKIQSFFKTALYLPVILPSAVVSAMWIMMYAGDEYGIFNIIFGMTNPPFQWMGNTYIAFFSIVLANTWRYLGITMIVYFVNMNAVSKEIIESASVDGANRFQIMMKIIFPLTWGATILNILMSMIGGIKSFDLFFLFLTNGNLPTTLTPVSVLIYRIGLGNANIININLSRSAAMSIVLAIILAVFSIIINKLMSFKKDN